MANKKRPQNFRALKFFGLIVLILIGVAVAYNWYASTHPLSNKQNGFQYYEPTKLPDGFHITQKRILIYKPHGRTNSIQAEMNLRTEDWVYEISEQNNGGTNGPSTTLANYNPASIKPTCRQVETSQHQSYRLCHWIDYGRIGVYQVQFVKGKTFIGTTFPGTTTSVVPVNAISTYVDSFVAAKASGFTLLISLGP